MPLLSLSPSVFIAIVCGVKTATKTAGFVCHVINDVIHIHSLPEQLISQFQGLHIHVHVNTVTTVLGGSTLPVTPVLAGSALPTHALV